MCLITLFLAAAAASPNTFYNPRFSSKIAFHALTTSIVYPTDPAPWHPDKFGSLYGDRLRPAESEKILARVNTVSQGVIELRSVYN